MGNKGKPLSPQKQAAQEKGRKNAEAAEKARGSGKKSKPDNGAAAGGLAAAAGADVTATIVNGW